MTYRVNGMSTAEGRFRAFGETDVFDLAGFDLFSEGADCQLDSGSCDW